MSGRLSWRRFGVLTRNLPAESATVRAGYPDARWDLHAQLLAGLIDSIATGNWQRGGGKGARPKPLPRPGVTDNKKRTGTARMTPAELRVALGMEEVDDGS